MKSKPTRYALLCCAFGVFTACDAAPDPDIGPAVGLYAVVVSDTGEVASNEFEVDLVADGPGAPTSSSPTQPMARPRLISESPRIERPTSASALSRLRSSADSLHSNADADSCERTPSSLRTHQSKICWLAEKTFSTLGPNERSLVRMLYFTPDGAYHAIVEATGIQTGFSFASAGFSHGTGCIVSPTGEYVDVAYLESLLGLAFSTSIMFYDFGISSFYTADAGLQRGFQFDTGISANLSLIPFLNFSVSKDLESSFLVEPTRVTGECGAQAEPSGDISSNPFSSIANDLNDLGTSAGDRYRDVMLREAAKAAQAGIAPLAGDGAPANSQAALVDDFLSRQGQELCADCSATSIDSFLFQLGEELGAAAGDGEATRQVVSRRFEQYQRSAPGAVPYALKQHTGANALRLAFLVHEDIAAEARGDRNRYVSPEIIDIDAEVGRPVALTVTAEEIAQLIGVSASAVDGAVITIDASPYLDAAEFELRGEVTVEFTPSSSDPILLRIEVDLANAAGPFAGDTSDWTVRPAMRRVHPQAGPPAAISVGAPVRSQAGDTSTLTALVTDEHYAPVTGAPANGGALVRFFDAQDTLLGEAPVVDGTAQVEVSLAPSTPEIATVDATPLELGDSTIVDGFTVSGRGFSEHAEIVVDGRSLAEVDAIYSIQNSRSILFTLAGSTLEAGEHSVVVHNPGGRRSKALSFTSR